MTGRRLLKALQQQFGCKQVRQESSHVRVECENCATTVPVHAGEDIGKGLLGHIQRDLEPCLGKRWLRRIR